MTPGYLAIQAVYAALGLVGLLVLVDIARSCRALVRRGANEQNDATLVKRGNGYSWER